MHSIHFLIWVFTIEHVVIFDRTAIEMRFGTRITIFPSLQSVTTLPWRAKSNKARQKKRELERVTLLTRCHKSGVTTDRLPPEFCWREPLSFLLGRFSTKCYGDPTVCPIFIFPPNNNPLASSFRFPSKLILHFTLYSSCFYTK